MQYLDHQFLCPRMRSTARPERAIGATRLGISCGCHRGSPLASRASLRSISSMAGVRPAAVSRATRALRSTIVSRSALEERDGRYEINQHSRDRADKEREEHASKARSHHIVAATSSQAARCPASHQLHHDENNRGAVGHRER